MFLLNNISESDAVRIFANYCSKNSTPADIFNFDGQLPRARIKYCPLIVYIADYEYSALVEITTETQIHSKSQLGYDSTAYKNNIKNSSSGFFESMYEDYADTRYTDSTVKQQFMDRANGTDRFVVIGNIPGFSVDEALYPTENLDSSLIIDDDTDYRLRQNPVVFEALSNAMENLSVISSNPNFQLDPPVNKIDYVVRNDIDSTLRKRYENCSFTIKDVDFTINQDSLQMQILYFPYYEFTFTYNRIPYTVNVAAHNQAEGSTGFFGGAKDVVVGHLPEFESVSGGLFKKLSARKDRNAQKKEDRDTFINSVSKMIVFTS